MMCWADTHLAFKESKTQKENYIDEILSALLLILIYLVSMYILIIIIILLIMYLYSASIQLPAQERFYE